MDKEILVAVKNTEEKRIMAERKNILIKGKLPPKYLSLMKPLLTYHFGQKVVKSNKHHCNAQKKYQTCERFLLTTCSFSLVWLQIFHHCLALFYSKPPPPKNPPLDSDSPFFLWINVDSIWVFFNDFTTPKAEATPKRELHLQIPDFTDLPRFTRLHRDRFQ